MKWCSISLKIEERRLFWKREFFTPCRELFRFRFLSTVLSKPVIRVRVKDGQAISRRCLMDQESQSSYVTEDLIQKLRVNRKRTIVPVSNLAGISAGKVFSIVGLTLQLEDDAGSKTKALIASRVRNGGLPRLPQRSTNCFQAKHWPTTVTELESHVPMLFEFDSLTRLFLKGVLV